MEMATMNRLMGRFILMVFAGLIPASEPFCRSKDRAAASMPLGTFLLQGGPSASGEADSVTIERRGRDYSLDFHLWNDRPVEFDARLFQLGADDEGRPEHFLDLQPRVNRPERHGLPPGATHLAAKVQWEVEEDRAWITFEPADREWLEDNKSMGLSTPALRELLSKGLKKGVFSGQASLHRK